MNWIRVAWLVFTLCFTPFTLAQHTLQTLRLESHSSARSQPLKLVRNSLLRVAPTLGGEVNPAIFIYDVTQGLVAKNDEDADRDAFEWSPPQSGTYQVVLYSKADKTVDFDISRSSREATRGPSPSNLPNLEVVPVFFATNRHLDNVSPVVMGVDPTNENDLHFGRLEVTIPIHHRRGYLESPSVLRLEFQADPLKHFAAGPLTLLNGASFYRELNDLALRSNRTDALVFIHGYNTTFEDAALRVAQLAHDLKFQGPTVIFSWPSQGHLYDYAKDQRNADLSAKPLSDFLRALARQSHVSRINVIAHSMGNRVLASALPHVQPNSKIRQIALIAPDIDAALFEQLADSFPKDIGPITLYVSSRDRALAASSVVAGYRRLGQAGQTMKAIPGIDLIDASSIDTSILAMGHDYYASSGKLLEDLYSFLQGLAPAQRFWLKPSADGRYWVLVP